MPAPWLAPLSLALLAVSTRGLGLTSQLWHDEISALNSIRRPALEIITSWPGSSSHVFYELWAHAGSVLFGEGPFGIRLPAALFGVAGVLMLYWLVLPLLGRRVAWFLGGLLALSYHHVFYSQNARGYTALIFFALLSTHLLLTIVRRGSASPGLLVAYALAGALGAYTNLFGMFVVAGHGCGVFGWRVIAARRGSSNSFPVARFLGAVAGAGAVTALLYMPMLRSILEYTRASVASPAEGPRLGGWLVVEVVEGLAAGFGGVPGLLVGLLVAVAGAWAWLRRAPLALALMVMPLALQTAALVAMGAGMHPRYFAVALPLVFLVGGLGVWCLLEAGIERLVPAGGRSRFAAPALTLLVLVSGFPLRRYYSIPKQDYLGAIALLDTLAAPQDRKVGVLIAANALNGYYHAGYEQVWTLDDLLALEDDSSRIWLVTTLERVLAVEAPELHQHIRRRYRVVRALPGSVGDATVRIHVRDS